MLLAIALLAQITTDPTVPPAPTPIEIQHAEPVRTKSLSEAAGGRKGALVWPTDVPRPVATSAPSPTPWPTYPPTPTMVPAPVPTVVAPPVKEEPLLSADKVIGLVALFAIVVLFFVWRSGRRPQPKAVVPTPTRRPTIRRPILEPEPADPAPAAKPEYEWRWGRKVGKAQELDVVGPGFQHLFLRRWGGQQDEELGAVGESFYMDALEGLVLHVVSDDVRSGSFDAWLKPEPDNPHDPNAVAVVAVEPPDFIEKVGHLSKADAKRWQPVLLELERKCGRGFLAHGRVIKGREEGYTHSVVIQGGMGPLEEILAALDAPPAPSAPKGGSRAGRTGGQP